jgi:hypothetical protein
VSGWLYRCWARDGTLLYVGITRRSVAARLAEHMRYSPWWDGVARTTSEAVAGDLLTAERDAIRLERPAWNRPPKPQIDCYVCNDRQCIIGPGYALVRCPRCAGGRWNPPLVAPLPPGPILLPELEP